METSTLTTTKNGYRYSRGKIRIIDVKTHRIIPDKKRTSDAKFLDEQRRSSCISYRWRITFSKGGSYNRRFDKPTGIVDARGTAIKMQELEPYLGDIVSLEPIYDYV